MFVDGKSQVTFGVTAFAAVALAFFFSLPASAVAQTTVPASAAGETLSWNGDPKAPNLSGVWVRLDAPAKSTNKEGWTPRPPPLKSKFAAIWKKRVAEAAAGSRTDDPIQRCLPPGMPRFMTGMTTPLLIIQTPGRMVLYRDGIPLRRIWLDGHPNPAPKDLESFYGGNAIGHYEGGDLVTEVVGIKDQPIDGSGVPHSDDLKVVERFHRVDATTMQMNVTLTDRTAYTRPMSTTVIYKAYGDPLWEPREVICVPKTNYHPERFVP